MINYGKELKYHRIVRNKSLRDCVILADYYEISLDELIGRDTYYK